MKKQKHQARTIALQALYQMDLQRLPTNVDVTPLIAPIIEENQAGGEIAAKARQLTAGTWTGREKYDAMIATVSAISFARKMSWVLMRIALP